MSTWHVTSLTRHDADKCSFAQQCSSLSECPCPETCGFVMDGMCSCWSTRKTSPLVRLCCDIACGDGSHALCPEVSILPMPQPTCVPMPIPVWPIAYLLMTPSSNRSQHPNRLLFQPLQMRLHKPPDASLIGHIGNVAEQERLLVSADECPSAVNTQVHLKASEEIWISRKHWFPSKLIQTVKVVYIFYVY